MKDNDRNRGLLLDAMTADLLRMQLKSDTEFHRVHGIMDYSALVKFYKDEQLPCKDQLTMNNNNLFRGYKGGVRGIKPDGDFAPEFYVVGIIDILQAYTTSKQAERQAKVAMGQVATEISVIAPTPYAE